jgi:hypothetical protein
MGTVKRHVHINPFGLLTIVAVLILAGSIAYQVEHRRPMNSPAVVTADEATYSSATSSGASTTAGFALATDNDNFTEAIRGDGITLEKNEAILQGHAVCMYGSIFDAMQQVQQRHSAWSTVTSTHFVDRSIQNYCPDRAPTG